ncbi:LysR family transcriptional regulator [Microbacterium sp. H1-D42]|uniref:LysR family transcriptional regulator n=1 Tax=Microbacterium sp. H1-D42 TaxID=2925844 RepID=UPI001F53C07E|nr:LysR family transcriptional regulator [Microbacterium sp. H1-D42]UNK71901.1 LysR family transcriptional regulator [Microbacterium sp. H1-D42]
MNVRHLEYFLAIVEYGGVHRAAEALRVAQSSVSQTMRSLEKDMGATLFHRVGRGIVLTPAGEGLVGSARAILREVENAQRVVTDIAEARGGHLDIAALPELVTDPLANWISSFLIEHPQVRCRVEQSSDVGRVTEMIRNGTSEIGFVSVPSAGDLEYIRLVQQVYVLLCPPGSESRWPDPVPLEMLRDQSFVLGERDSNVRDLIETTLRRHGVEPRIVLEARQREAVLPIALTGSGMGIVPLRLGAAFWQRGGVVRELEPAISTTIYLVKRPGQLTMAGESFLASARASLQSWVDAVDEPELTTTPLIERAAQAMADWDERARASAATRSAH